MSGTLTPADWSYAEYARLPDDGNRYEVLDGEVLMTPSPGTTHQRVAVELFMRLREYVSLNRLGEMLWDLDVLFATGHFLRPDMVFVPQSERHLLSERGVEGRPGLIVEIVSPSSIRIDKVRKPARYGDLGIPEYWAVDPPNRSVLVWRFDLGASEPRIETDRLIWQPDPAAPPFELNVADLFIVP